jgi:DNA helicase-2/ATP-dependent DNA helicase PcrA
MKTVPKAFGVESFTIIDRDDQLSLMKLIRGSVLNDRNKKNFPQARGILELYSYSRNTCTPAKEYLTRYTEYDDDTIDVLMKVFNQYTRRKKYRNYIDFDDILHIFLETISNNTALLNKLKSLFSNILVDEMQDTNPLQWGILEKLAKPSKLFCVGDDAQSIYAFRGADFQNVHSFKKRMPDSDILKLDLNYRSTQEILDVANWQLNLSSLAYNRKLSAVRGKGNKPKLIEFRNYFDEAAWYGNEILKRHGEGTPYSDFMILVRSAYLARRIEAVFVEKNVPYKFIGGTQLMQSAHVRDLFSLLRVVINYRDELAWIRYLKLWPRVGDITAAKAIEGIIVPEVAESGYQFLETFFSGEDYISEAVEKVRNNISKPNKAINMALKYLLPLLSEKYDHWSARAQDLQLLERLSKRFTGLAEFIETYTLDPVYNKEHATPAVDDAVTIITIHSAKGTEAPICMIPQLVPGVYPHSRSLGKDDEIEEERRVLYVALTRAENELILTRAGGTGRNIFFGGSGLGDKDHVNYFLTDIPKELVDNEFVENEEESSFLDGLEGFE